VSVPKTRRALGDRVAIHLRSRREPFVMVMQSAEFGEFDYPAPVGRMYGPRTRSIHPQRKVSPPQMVVTEVCVANAG
jgi:hypothetical protein